MLIQACNKKDYKTFQNSYESDEEIFGALNNLK
jgi:hypothetical protein